MKLPLLLTQYLYENKQLNLPGIGSFVLDPAAIIPEDPEKNPHEMIQGVTFNNKPVYKADDQLIDFIRINTGKIKPLAEADLESYLALGIQLLNIGKPFYLEGIGAITKSQEGHYDFTAGEYVPIKKNDPDTEKKEKADKRKSVFEEQHDVYEPQQSNSLRKGLVFLGVLAGLAFIGWGGYTLYKKNTYPENASDNTMVIKDSVTAKSDTSINASAANTVSLKTDSLQSRRPTTVTTAVSYKTGDSSLYKFIVLATDKKYKALKRYQQLLCYELKIKMETKDSSFFKLYFAFPALVKDTVRIKDSLNRVYATRVSIEK